MPDPRFPTRSIPTRINPIAVITGASSGIGKAFASRLAKDGFDLVITGRQKKRLETLAEELTVKYKTSVEILLAEFSDPRDRERVADRIKELDRLHTLVNNAGFGITGNFAEVPYSTHEEMMLVHCVTPMCLTRAALPGMLKRRIGVIINVSSVAAFTPSSSCATYNATKAFLNSFSEGLHLEVRDKGIQVQALCPGWTRTEFHTRRGIPLSSLPSQLWVSPEFVVDKSMEALKKGKVVYIPGLRYKMMGMACKYMPRWLYYSVMPKLANMRRKWQKKGQKKNSE
ncbi:MAG: SDR family NAD(P)-dependent oxidoreductase [Chitinivibrionales bacterium]|nr:SDR family NAD(P)-dependent oxidoreductase [Chitinivibrionales bacterium]